MMRSTPLFLFLLITLAFSACTNKNNDSLITFHTPFGDMKAILYDQAPGHKANFLKLAKSGAYDSTTWHRVINDFMIQGGDLAEAGMPEKAQKTIPAEFNKALFHQKGAIAAARRGDNINPEKRSSACQFYIVDGVKTSKMELIANMPLINKYLMKYLPEVPGYDSVLYKLNNIYQAKGLEAYNAEIFKLVPMMEKRFDVPMIKKDYPQARIDAYKSIGGVYHLDDEYTVFGQVVQGLPVIDQLAAVQTGKGDRPVEDIHVSISIEELPKAEISRKYGVIYSENGGESVPLSVLKKDYGLDK